MAKRSAPRDPQLDGREVAGRGPAGSWQSTGRGRGDRAVRLGRIDRSLFAGTADAWNDR